MSPPARSSLVVITRSSGFVSCSRPPTRRYPTMLQPSPTDDWIVAVLKDVETPEPPAKLFVIQRRGARLWHWLAPAGIVSAGAVLAATLTLQPTPTLAQVIESEAKLTHFTLVNTRVLTDGSHISLTTYRDGARWSYV